MKCETVIIKTDNGAVTINKCDFDKKVHTLFAEPKKTDSKKAASKKRSKPE